MIMVMVAQMHSPRAEWRLKKTPEANGLRSLFRRTCERRMQNEPAAAKARDNRGDLFDNMRWRPERVAADRAVPRHIP
jgi:hypothetical protein